MKTLEEIGVILDEASDDNSFLRITLGIGLSVEKDVENKKIAVTYPKLEMGMSQHVLKGRLCNEEDEYEEYYEGIKDGKTELLFETYFEYTFVLKAKEIEDCKYIRENEAVMCHEVVRR